MKKRRFLWRAAALGAVVVLSLAALAVLRAQDADERVRRWVVSELRQRFNSDVQLKSLRLEVLPRMDVSGEGLSIRYHNRADLPPMFHVERFSFHLGLLGIFRAPRHIRGIRVENMTITIPPRGEPKNESLQSQLKSEFSRSSVVVDEIVCDNTALVIIPKKEGKEPLEFDIHDLILKSVASHEPFAFHGTLTNAKPRGEIATSGTIGPWNVEEPGDTAVAGSYSFTNADLGPFPGIAGILSSTGKYEGRLNELEVAGETDTPDFSLDPVGTKVALHTDFSATVNGMDGDTYLHPVRATLGKSVIVATGSVVKAPGDQGHAIVLDVRTDKARLEDMLRLAMKGPRPFLTGALTLKTKFLLPAGRVKVLDALKLDGDFTVTDGHWASEEIRDKLEAFSRHAEGHPNDEEAGSSVSGMRGRFRFDKDQASFRNLTFTIPGAAIALHGSYDLRSEELAFEGDLRMQAKLSKTVTGKKSFFLKVIDPFFEKEGAGTLIPITISGTRENPTIGTSIFHKKIEKTLGDEKSKQVEKPSPSRH